MSNLHNFNAGRKSWKMYSKELTSISGDDLTISPYEGEDLILEVSGNGNILFKEDGITYNLADLSNAASSNVNLTNYDDASFGNVDISGSLTFKGGDFNFNYVAGATPNYINSFNYLANTTLIDANSDNIFTTNNTNLDITYSPTLNIFVNLRRDSLLYSYDGISWYFCKKSDNSNFSFSGKYSGTIEWFGGNVNKFYVSLTHAGFSSTDSIYYSSNGINWTNVTVNGGAYQFMPHKLAYSPTLNKIVATGSGNGLEGLWVGDATGSSLDFTNIATNNEFISPWESDGGMFPLIWDTNLEKFILTTEATGGGKQLYYNDSTSLTTWTLITNIYDFNNNLTTDGTLNKNCYSIAFSPTLNRSVFVGGDAIYYSDFVGGNAITNLVFKQTKDINGSNYSGSPTYRKIIWDSVSEYFIVAGNAGLHDVIYSANGINWFSNNQETSTPSGYLARDNGALAYGNGKLILIGYHNNNVYQTDSNYIATSIADIYNFGHNNLDASFNNLDISGNLKISNGIINFFASDEQLLGPDTGIAQKVQDLSNNLLISNNDASFNNLDISGTIKLPDSSNNGYGVSGEILTSRGSSNTPYWVTPSTGVTYTAGSNMTLSGTEFNIPQDIATTATPTFTNLTATGTIFANTIDRYANGGVQIFGNVNSSHITIEHNHPSHAYGSGSAGSWYGGFNGANLFAGTSSFRARSNQCQASHNLTITSDDRFKSRTVNLPDNCLDIINKLQPKKYLKHHGHYVPEGVEDSDLSGVDTKDEAGLISQDVEKIPELNWLITEQELGIDTKKYYKAIDYGSLYPYLIKAVQELNEFNKSLEARIKVLENK